MSPPITFAVPAGREPEAPPGSVPLADASLGFAFAPVPALAAPPAHTVDPPGRFVEAPAERRIHVLKDAAIGLGIAAVVLGAFYGGKYLLFGDRPGTQPADASATGIIAVTVADLEPGEVHLNGKKVGVVEDGAAFTLESLHPGEYEVMVRRPGAPDCVQSVDLRAKRIEVVQCRLTSVSRQAQLVLEGIDEGARVFVDRQEISAAATREPLLLDPGQPHEILVERAGAEPASIPVTLAPGERVTRQVPPPRPKRSAVRTSRPSPQAAPRPPQSPRVRTPAPTPGPKTVAPVAVVATERAESPPDGVDAAEDKEAASTAPTVGYLVAWTTPWARVLIDGQDTGVMTPIAPRAKIPLTPGKHIVAFVVGVERFQFPVVIEPGQVVKLNKNLPVAAP
jgi:hypothetical protein